MPDVHMYTEALAGRDETCRWMSADAAGAFVQLGYRASTCLLPKPELLTVLYTFSLNSMGPTRMRLSCNFVNVYTIAYRVQ